MFDIKRTDSFKRSSKKFFNNHRNLIKNFQTVTSKLSKNPFEPSLKTHKLKDELKEFYACHLNYEYRIVLTILIKDNEITLIDIGTHDEVY